MGDNRDTLEFEHEWQGNKVRLTARWRGEPVHIDTIDPANATHRQRFLKALREKLPQADPEAVERELLRLADAPRQQPEAGPAGGPPELDISRIVRPELFITPEVVGLSVPVAIRTADGPAGRWALYLRWADGRRERRDLAGSIDLADGGRLWIHPNPAAPAMGAAPGWSARARRAWLDGAPAPDPAELFKRLCERIAYFIDLPPDVAAGTAATLALWSMLTYIYPAWDAVPYLYVGGPLGSGKSTVFGSLARLVYRPLASSSLTGPALFRTLHECGGTVLYDEAERLRQSTPEAGEILAMLLAGYKKDGRATRLEAVGDTFRTVAFDVFGPKALACVAGLPPALASRCIPVTMFRADPDSPKPRRRIDVDPAAWQGLRDELHALALENGAAWLDLARRSEVCPVGISGRAYELWQPLLALAWGVESRGAEGLLSLMQRFALDSINAGRDDQIPDADEMLLEVLADKLRMGASPTPGEIYGRAKELDPATFDRWTPRTVSNRLKTYGIVARKVDRRREYRDTTLGDLARIQRSYGIALGISPEPDTTPPAPSFASRIVPESPVSGRNGTQRDARDAS